VDFSPRSFSRSEDLRLGPKSRMAPAASGFSDAPGTGPGWVAAQVRNLRMDLEDAGTWGKFVLHEQGDASSRWVSIDVFRAAGA